MTIHQLLLGAGAAGVTGGQVQAKGETTTWANQTAVASNATGDGISSATGSGYPSSATAYHNNEWSWVCPADVTMVDVLCIGAGGGGAGGGYISVYVPYVGDIEEYYWGGGGGGGGLIYKNKIPVTAGNTYKIGAGTGGSGGSGSGSGQGNNGYRGGSSYFATSSSTSGGERQPTGSYIRAYGGGAGSKTNGGSASGGTYASSGTGWTGGTGHDGGNGGLGRTGLAGGPGGGGGGAGYNGDGGQGVSFYGSATAPTRGNPQSAGGGSGGGGRGQSNSNLKASSGGGGTGPLGWISTGYATIWNTNALTGVLQTVYNNSTSEVGLEGGYHPSGAAFSGGGTPSQLSYHPNSNSFFYQKWNGGFAGGGGGGGIYSQIGASGGAGVVRIIWSSEEDYRSWPYTNIRDM